MQLHKGIAAPPDWEQHAVPCSTAHFLGSWGEQAMLAKLGEICRLGASRAEEKGASRLARAGVLAESPPSPFGSRNTPFTVHRPSDISLERTSPPPMVFTNHETRNTNHGFFRVLRPSGGEKCRLESPLWIRRQVFVQGQHLPGHAFAVEIILNLAPAKGAHLLGHLRIGHEHLEVLRQVGRVSRLAQ